jgi:hypothetical protein
LAFDGPIVSAVRKPLAAASCLTLLLSKPAIAQTPATSTGGPPFSVAIERDEQAVSCPDLAWFSAHIASHAGKVGHAGSFKLALSRRGEAWQAKIQRAEPSNDASVAERNLEDRSSSCEPLAEAAALTIAILADDLAQRAAPGAAAKLPAPQGASQPPPDASEIPKSPRKKRGSKVWVGAGGGAAMSFISPMAPLLGFGLALDSLYLSSGLRVMVTTEQSFELPPGHVVVQAWLATAFSCLRAAGGAFGAALCGTLDASMLRASAEGFDQGTPSRRTYGAVGLEAHPSWYLSDSYRISAALGLLLPFTRESFSVNGRGVAYIPPQLNWRVLVFSEIGAF